MKQATNLCSCNWQMHPVLVRDLVCSFTVIFFLFTPFKRVITKWDASLLTKESFISWLSILKVSFVLQHSLFRDGCGFIFMCIKQQLERFSLPEAEPEAKSSIPKQWWVTEYPTPVQAVGNNSAQVLMWCPLCLTATSCPGNSKGHHSDFTKTN